MKDNEINFGEVKVPASWSDITLGKFQKIEKYYEDKDRIFNVMDVLDIMIDKDRDYIMRLPNEFLDIILEKLMFLQTPPEEAKPDNKVEINGETYRIHFENQLKVGEYVAADSILKQDSHNYAAFLAILCRKDDEIYDSKFENEILEDRIKFWESQPVTKILPLISFFLLLYGNLTMITQLSSQVQENINHIASYIQTSRKNGELSILSTLLLKRKLRKLKKSIKNI